MKWFKDCETIEEVKQTYKKLALQYHPDVAKQSTHDIMAEINNEYENAASAMKNRHKNIDGEIYEKDTPDTAAEFRDIITVIIRFEGVKIEMCGSWLWVSGDTKQYKETLKELKFRWSSNKMAWYYHNEPYRKKSKKQMTLDEIRETFGSSEIETRPAKKLSA